MFFEKEKHNSLGFWRNVETPLLNNLQKENVLRHDLTASELSKRRL